jgi:hypothetical protein
MNQYNRLQCGICNFNTGSIEDVKCVYQQDTNKYKFRDQYRCPMFREKRLANSIIAVQEYLDKYCLECGEELTLLGKNGADKPIYFCPACIVTQLKNSNETLKAYQQTDKFKEIYIKIVAWLDAHQESLNDNAYSEPLFEDITNEEFIYWCHAAIIGLPHVTENEGFETEIYTYQDLEISYTHGQGTLTSVIKKEWKKYKSLAELKNSCG